MPPRLLSLGIIIFWLATTCWLVVREVVPRFRAGDAPPFSIDLIDEVGASTSSWSIYFQNERIGNGLTWVERRRDRTFLLANEFKFEKLHIIEKVIHLRKSNSSIHVNTEGEFLGMSMLLKIRISPAKPRGPLDYQETEFGINAHVDADNMLNFKIEIPGAVIPKELVPAPIRLPYKGSILNPMHLVNKITGLQHGKSWRIPVLDPLPALLPGQDVKTKEVLADVQDDDLDWHGHVVSCFKIDYREPGQKIMASTWVRQIDGLVLQQEALHQGMKLLLIRENK